MKQYRCQHCSYTVNINNSDKKSIISAKHKMGKHYEDKHKDLLPSDMTGYQWFYFQLTKKDHGSCIVCHKNTDFNEATMKYCRFCNNPKCKEVYKHQVDQRMIDKYGKTHLLDDPEMQKKMQQGRRIAGVYTWSDGKQFPYLSSYELDFLQYLDKKVKWPSSDIMAPSPHTYEYEYNEKKHFYMPDFFIPTLKLEIEIKDDGSALRINSDSRAKDVIKNDLMKSLMNKGIINYIKIINKNYTQFDEFIKKEERIS